MSWKMCIIPVERPFDNLKERVDVVGFGNPEMALFYRISDDNQRILLLTPAAAQFTGSLAVDWRTSDDHRRYRWSILAGPTDAFGRFDLEPTGGIPRDGGDHIDEADIERYSKEMP